MTEPTTEPAPGPKPGIRTTEFLSAVLTGGGTAIVAAATSPSELVQAAGLIAMGLCFHGYCIGRGTEKAGGA